MTVLLKPVELLWRGVNRLRRSLYRRGVLNAKRLPHPVISVGNISAGGAGKTPAVIALARALGERGMRVAVLTRGYRAEGEGLVTELDAARFGDEPVLIKRSVNRAEVIVGKNRYKNAQRYSTAEVFILDDGFQHLQLARDVDVVIDAAGSGILREGRPALRDADFVIQRNLRLVVPDSVRGKRLFAFCGLANNDQFFASLRDAGLELAGTRGFRDHHRYTPRDLDAIRAAARNANAEMLVTTEKDAVKIGDAEVVAIPAEMIIDPAVIDAIVARIRK